MPLFAKKYRKRGLGARGTPALQFLIQPQAQPQVALQSPESQHPFSHEQSEQPEFPQLHPTINIVTHSNISFFIVFSPSF